MTKEKTDAPTDVVDEIPNDDSGFEVEGVSNDEQALARLEAEDKLKSQEAEELKGIDGESEKKKSSKKNDDAVDETPPTDDSGENGKPKKGNNIQKRISKKHAELMSERERADRLEAELLELKASKEKPKAKEPDPDDYEDVDSYLEAVSKWEEDSKSKKDDDEGKKKANKEDQPAVDRVFVEAKRSLERAITDWDDIPDDFNEVALADTLPVTPDVVVALTNMDEPAKMFYWLGKNPEEAAKIASMTPQKIAIALAKVEAKEDLSFVKPAANKKITAAPEPISPIGGNDGAKKDLEDMDFAEFSKEMNKRDSRRFW